MREDSENLHGALEEIFSLVPSEEAIASSKEVVSRYFRDNAKIGSNIVWADFESDGDFVRGGISNINSMSSRLILDETETGIADILEDADANGLNAGRLTSASDDRGFYWCIPYTPPASMKFPRSLLRVIFVTEELFFEILQLFNQDAGLTPAERRMVYQLVLGLKPNEAAEQDNVSVETKRSQLKKATAKLGGAGQVELIRLLMGQMIHILYLCEAESYNVQTTEDFASKFFGSSVKLSVQRLSNGRLMRFWELGPAAGTPVLLLHAYLFPVILLNSVQELERHNIRLIAPIRSGYLDNQECHQAYFEGNLTEQVTEDLISFVRQACPTPIPVIGQSTGGLYAMLMAQTHRDLFTQIVIVAINLMKPKSQSYASNFFGGIRKLAGKSEIYESVVQQFHKTAFSSKRTTKFLLRKLFAGCKPDLEVLDGVVGSGPSYEWFSELHSSSSLGVANDIQLISQPQVKMLGNIPDDLPIHFIHGSEDPFTRQEHLKGLIAGHPNAELTIFSDAGNLLVASHARQLWSEIGNILALDAAARRA